MGGKILARKITYADVAQEVAHVLGKDEVTGSSPVISLNENLLS